MFPYFPSLDDECVVSRGLSKLGELWDLISFPLDGSVKESGQNGTDHFDNLQHLKLPAFASNFFLFPDWGNVINRPGVAGAVLQTPL